MFFVHNIHKPTCSTRLSTYVFDKVTFFILQKLPYYRYFGKFYLYQSVTARYF